MPSTNESYLQAANIKIKINNFNITISSAYFPPNQPISEPKIHSFFHSLGNFLIIGGEAVRQLAVSFNTNEGEIQRKLHGLRNQHAG
ncbi:unnamed protein product [Macrosiphum euphorbiae]|uniref:Uncharacterized protein n=1 Tax=Macrosiphum euphorbiae TaxID=13131 RepID=A0AAV0WNA1_9HEMI|nr:unnamed protein product [Macrosiphum euphorbiae]